MIRDNRNREIGERIIEVVVTNPGLPKLSRDEISDSRFYFCHEFFVDGHSLTCSLPANFSRSLNANYYGWQKIDLSRVDWNQYRPEGQRTDVEGATAEGVDRYAISEAGCFDRHVANDVWIRFVQNENSFLSRFNSPCRMSSNIRRAILRFIGFEYCGRRFFPTEEKDPFGLPIVNPGIEIFASPTGLIVTWKVSENMDWFWELSLTVKYHCSFRDFNSFLCPRGGSYEFREGLTSANDGLIVKYQSVNMGFLRKIMGYPILIQHWGQGVSGLDELWLWGHEEFDLFSCGSPEWNEMKENIREQIQALADKYALLKRICCDAE